MIATEPSASSRRRLPKQILPKQYLLRCSSANFLCRRFCDSQSFHVQREAITFNQERARGSISIGSELQISTAFHNVPNLVRDQGVGGSNPLSPTNSFPLFTASARSSKPITLCCARCASACWAHEYSEAVRRIVSAEYGESIMA